MPLPVARLTLLWGVGEGGLEKDCFVNRLSPAPTPLPPSVGLELWKFMSSILVNDSSIWSEDFVQEGPDIYIRGEGRGRGLLKLCVNFCSPLQEGHEPQDLSARHSGERQTPPLRFSELAVWFGEKDGEISKTTVCCSLPKAEVLGNRARHPVEGADGDWEVVTRHRLGQPCPAAFERPFAPSPGHKQPLRWFAWTWDK